MAFKLTYIYIYMGICIPGLSDKRTNVRELYCYTLKLKIIMQIFSEF